MNMQRLISCENHGWAGAEPDMYGVHIVRYGNARTRGVGRAGRGTGRAGRSTGRARGAGRARGVGRARGAERAREVGRARGACVVYAFAVIDCRSRVDA